MRNLFFIAITSILFAACAGTNSESPKAVVNAFMEASKKGDIDGLKKYITKQDVSVLELGESFLKVLDSTQKNSMKEKMANDFKEKTKDVKIDIGNEKINGDNATVDVSITKEGKTETQPFTLKKEEGEWKISLMSTGMKASGMTQQQMDEKMDKMKEGVKDMAGMKDSLAKAMEKLKGVNTDSIKKVLEKNGINLDKLKEAAEKSGH